MRYGIDEQVFVVRAFNASGGVKGDAANITCKISIDGGSPVDLTNNTPTQNGDTNQYTFTLTAAETTATKQIVLNPVSSTSGVEVMGAAGNVFTPVIFQPQSQVVRAVSGSVSTPPTPTTFTFLRPDGTSQILRPDGTSNYLRAS